MSSPAPPIDPPHPEPAAGGPSWFGRPWAWLRGMRRRTLLNLGIALLIVLVLVAALITLLTPKKNENPARTVAVTRGTVTATVAATGNAESSLATPVSFVTQGVLTSVPVKPGETVTNGQVLATIDDAAARTTLATAQAQLANAQAGLAQTAAGPTDVKRRQDQASVDQAQQGVNNAQATLKSAQDARDLDDKSTQTAIDNAKATLKTDTRTQNDLVDAAEENLDNCRSGNSTTTTTSSSTTTNSSSSSSSSSSCTSQEQALTSAKNTRRSTLQTDEQSVTSARQTRDSTLQKDDTTIQTDQQAVTTAEGNLTNAKLTQEANLHPHTPDEIAQQQATVDQNQASVDGAQRGVDDTSLRAPQDGVVLSVANKVGETSTTGSTSSTSDSSASGDATSSGAGFIVLSNLSRLAVSVNLAEAGATQVKLGQAVKVTFPGSNAATTGSVTQITPQSTVSNNVVQYPVKISLDTAPPGVGVGSTANLSISTKTAVNVLQVPTAAITTVGDRRTVVVRRGVGDKITDTVVPVEVGVVGDTTTEIRGGVSAGDQLVLPATGAS